MQTRREFLGQTAVTLAVAARSGAAVARQSGRMYVSLNSSLTKQVEWPDFARLAARVGYGGVDVNLNGAKAQGVDATRALFAELKIRPTGANLPFQFGGPTAPTDEDLKQLDEGASFAAAIGCHRMMAVLPPSGPAPKAERRPVI